MSDSFHFRHALLPGGFARDVRVTVENGVITAVLPSSPGAPEPGIAVPGLANLHSHAFQRGMAGLAERRGPQGDSFWTWREVMYGFLSRLSPDDVEAIAALAFLEMLERGFTCVGEFHYLHHDPDGRPYGDPGELAGRIVAAAASVGIGLTLLPAFYGQGGFGGAPPSPGQRRFVSDLDGFARLLEGAERHAASWPGTRVGVAPHSLRAVTPETLRHVAALRPEAPLHIHAAEQTREVEECLAWSGRRPVAWLLDEMAPDRRWCLIHATHTIPDETERLAGSGAVVGLCPLTESSLGDGIFDGPRFLLAGGAFGIGSDSNVEIDAAAELRQLEYAQRLGTRGRNVMTTQEGESTGGRLLAEALSGGARATGQAMGAIAPGCRADFVILDEDHPGLAAADGRSWVDGWIFSAGRDAVSRVVSGGQEVVREGRHRDRDAVRARYRATMRRLMSA